jgi:hypothetical protein
MHKRRVLDAEHIGELLQRVIRREGRVTKYLSETGEQFLRLECEDFPSIDIQISDLAVDTLAEQVRQQTLIAPSNLHTFIGRLVAIARLANNAGPKVSGFSDDSKSSMPLVNRICTKFAIECALSYALCHRYAIDARRIPQPRATVALMMQDARALAGIFEEALGIAPSSETRGRHAKPADAQYHPGGSGEGLIEYLESLEVYGEQMYEPTSENAERHISAVAFWNLLSFASLDDWSNDHVFWLLDKHMSPHNQIQGPATNHLGRLLSATAYWNLRSTADLEGWSADEMLSLIDEHLSPALHPDLVPYMNNISGSDWKHLYNWMFRSGE